MMREMEKVFENLKEEFNRKISSDSFISYFVNQNDVSGGGSSSESFEDISMETIMPSNVIFHETSEPSIQTESSNDNELLTFNEGQEVIIKTDEIILEEVSFYDIEVRNIRRIEFDKSEEELVPEPNREHLRPVRDSIVEYQVIEMARSVSADKPLNVISEEDILEPAKDDIIEDIVDNTYSPADELVNIDVEICATDLNIDNDKHDVINDQSHCDQIFYPTLESTDNSVECHASDDIESSDLNNISVRVNDDVTHETKIEQQDTCKNGELFNVTTHQEGSPVHRVVKKQSLHRMLWSEMPEVVESGVLAYLSKKQIQLQEAMFEILTSEASYYRSLMILTSHFFDSDLFKVQDNKDSLASPLDKHHIFSNVILIMSTSQKFLNDLDQRWLNEKPLLTQICDVILKHASGDDFQHYVTYLRNQEYQSKALKRLAENEVFRQQLNKLENSLVCGKLSMDSYLMLPMQRLTRLKLLVDALLKVMYSDELREFVVEEHINTAEMTVETLKMLLDTSDLEKGFMDQKGTLMSLMNKMDFPPNFKRITISDKVFIKEGEVRIHQQNPMRNIKKFSKKRQPVISMIFFNDLLILAKKKGLRLLVIDYCDRGNIEVSETKYKSIASSADVSLSARAVDSDDAVTEDGRNLSINSLVRSKSSLPPDEMKRFSTSLTSSFRSLPLTNRNDEQEIINNSFSLKFTKSQTDIFIVPIVVLAKNRAERDEWMSILSTNSTSDGRLHKTTSLRHTIIRNEEFCKNKNLYAQRKDEIIDQILAQREIAQDCSDEFMTIKYDYRITVDK